MSNFLKDRVYKELIQTGSFTFDEETRKKLPNDLTGLVNKCYTHPQGFACSAFKLVKGSPKNTLVNRINEAIEDTDLEPLKDIDFIMDGWTLRKIN